MHTTYNQFGYTEKWGRHLDEMERGKFVQCTRRLRDASDKELKQLQGMSFVARAIAAMFHNTPRVSWNMKELEPMEY